MPDKNLSINPGEIKRVKITLKTHKQPLSDKNDFVKIKVLDRETKKELSYTSSITRVYASKSRVDETPKYHYIPSLSTFVAGFQNSKKSIFLNTEGSGALNKEKTEKFSYLFRIPIIQHTSVYRELGGTPEKYFLHYKSPHFDLYGGDGVYQITPLTMTSRFGRGGYLLLKTPKIQIGGLSVIHSSSVPKTDISTFIKFLPHEYFDIQTSYYRTQGRIFEEQPDKKDAADIFSFDTVYRIKDKVSVQGELAYSTLKGLGDSQKAFFLVGFLKPHRIAYINFQKIYAPYNFMGYFSNQSQGDFSFGLNPYKRLNIVGSYNAFNINLKKNPELYPSTKYNRYLGEITYTFPKGIFLALSYNRFKQFDRASLTGYQTNFGGLRVSQSYKKFSLLLNAELGSYKNKKVSELNKTWQNYQAYTYLRMKNITYSVYGRWGDIAQARQIEWNQTYGGSISLYYNPVRLKIAYEQSLKSSLLTRQYLYGKLSYEFKNRSLVDVYGNFLRNFEGPNIYRLLVSYSFPWGLPVKKNIYRSRLRGRVYTEEKGIVKPSAQAIITCNEREKKLSSKGLYAFDYLKPGDYLIDIEGYDKDQWITDHPYPESLHLEPESKVEKDIVLKRPAQFEGNISFYKVKDENTEKAFQYLIDKGSFSKLSLVHDKTQEIIEVMTDSKGDFSLPRLRPGLWHVQVTPPQLSNNYNLETPEFAVELKSGDHYYKTIRILPIIRKLKMID